MNRLFGAGKAKQPPPSITDVVSNIDSRGETVEKKIGKLTAEINQIGTQMKKMRDGPAKNALKQKAMRLLKQRKLYEGQQAQLQQQSFNLEQQNFAIQNMKDTKATVDAMKVGVKQFKSEFKKFDIDKVEDLQDQMEDLMDQSNEVQEIMSRSYGMPEVDDAELEAELSALGDDIAADTDASYLDAANAPAVPSAIPGAESGFSPPPSKPSAGKEAVPLDEFGLPQIPSAASSRK